MDMKDGYAVSFQEGLDIRNRMLDIYNLHTV